MAKIRLTKNELKRQREILERFRRYLPILELKKQQLIFEIRNISRTVDKIKSEIEGVEKQVLEWADVFAEEINIKDIISIKSIELSEGNIAGIDIPLIDKVVFEEKAYDLFATPLWVDKAVDVCKEQLERRARIEILKKQIKILSEELRTTIQRINLFEKVKIPQVRENIRIIQIYLGDLQTAEVVRGKIAKAKIESKKGIVSL